VVKQERREALGQWFARTTEMRVGGKTQLKLNVSEALAVSILGLWLTTKKGTLTQFSSIES
jgi:hypothetical protein